MTGSRWEISESDWETVRATVRDRLQRSARMNHTIAYSNLSSGLRFSGPDSHALAEMLGEISADCASAGEPLLSALAVYISGEHQGEPGPGFSRAACSLGLLSADASAEEARIFWADQVERCYRQWGRSRSRST